MAFRTDHGLPWMQISYLRCEQDTKAKEFAEVKDLSSKLMEVMGTDRSRTATKSNVQRIRSNRGNNSSLSEHCLQDVNSAVDPRHRSVSSAANIRGPYAKRKNTPRSFKPFTQANKISAPLGENDGGTINIESRSAFKEAEVSPKKQVTTVPAQPLFHRCSELHDVDSNGSGKENEEICFDEKEYEYSSDDIDIFTSTDARHHRN